ncbi:MAG TPA: acetyl-CoA C-acyltransferase, partial [Flavobacteriaceae bacterium]|nr:acetyl-CoA C-acyltransferase [Flavobacteriaceae bacterium]
AQKYNVSREAQDEFSYNSHMKALKALDNGTFKDDIVPIDVEQIFLD